MNQRSLLILAAVGLVLVAYLGFYGIKDPGTTALKEREKQLFDFNSEELTRMELTTPSENLLLLRDADKKWLIEKPIQYPADENNVERVISELNFARRQATLDPSQFKDIEQAEKSMGLTDPRIDLKLRSEKHSYRLSIGNETARPGNYYAQLKVGNQQQWVVIGDGIEKTLNMEVDGWRSRKIFSFMTPEVTSILLNVEGIETEVSKEGGQWLITRPFSGATEPMGVISYLGDMLSSKIISFAPDDDSGLVEYGLNSPAISLKIKSGGQRSEILSIGAKTADTEESYFAQISSQKAIFRVSGKLVLKIKDLLARVRQKCIALQPISEINKMRIQTNSEQWSIHRVNGQWKFTEGENEVDTAKVQKFYQALLSVKGVDFFEKSEKNRREFGLNRPEFKIRLFSDASEEAGGKSISYASSKKGGGYVESDEHDFIVKVNAEGLPDFPARQVDWMPLKLTLPPVDEWTSISWKVPQGDLKISRTTSGAWPEKWKDRLLDQDFLKRQTDLLGILKIARRVYLPNGESSLASRDLVLSIQSKEGEWRLVFGSPENREVRLCVNNRREGYVIGERDFQLLMVFPLAHNARDAEGSGGE